LLQMPNYKGIHRYKVAVWKLLNQASVAKIVAYFWQHFAVTAAKIILATLYVAYIQ